MCTEKGKSSANNQKIRQLSIISSESIDYSMDHSIDSEFTQNDPTSFTQIDIQNMISIIALVLNKSNIEINLSLNPLETLSQLTSIICTEYLKKIQIVKEINIVNPQKNVTEEHTVNIYNPLNDTLINRIFHMSERGIVLNTNDCKHLIDLLIGILRDSACEELIRDIENTQKKIIKYNNTSKELKNDIKEKDLMIGRLKRKLEGMKNLKNEILNAKIEKNTPQQ